MAATGPDDKLTDFSNYGRAQVDIAAPGKSILSSGPAFRSVLSEDFQDADGNPSAPGWQTDSFGPNPAKWQLFDDWVGWSIADSPGACTPGLQTGGCYAHNVRVRLESPAADLSGMRGCSVSNWLRLSTQEPRNGQLTDYLSVVATDGATSETLDAYHGEVHGRATSALDTFNGRPNVRIQYWFQSDADNPRDESGEERLYDGADIDDFNIKCQSSRYEHSDWYYSNGTSMASPHVAGVAALLWARKSSATVAEVREALLTGVDAKPDLAATTASGGRLNAATALARLPLDPTPPRPAPAPAPAARLRLELSKLTIKPVSFHASAGRASIVARGGAQVRYVLSDAATATFSVERAGDGRSVGGRCVKATRRNRGKRRCTRLTALRGAFAHSGTAGDNRFRFGGRLRRRALAPGRYRLVARATDGRGAQAAARSASFRMRPARGR